MINRRIFLKSVGAAVAVISVPAIAKAKTFYKTDSYKMIDWQRDFAKYGQRWISFSEEMPKVGQKVIMASEVTALGFISGGVIAAIHDRSSCGSSYVSLSAVDDFYVGYHSSRDAIGLFYSEKGKEVISTRDWIRENESVVLKNYTRHNLSSHYGNYYKDSYLWLAVDGDYPTTIPPIPINPVYAELEKR